MDLTSRPDPLRRHQPPSIVFLQLKQCGFGQERGDRRIPPEIWNDERERTLMPNEGAFVVRKRMKCFFGMGMDLRPDHEPLLPQKRLQRRHLSRIDGEA